MTCDNVSPNKTKVLMYFGTRIVPAWYSSTKPFVKYAQYVNLLNGISTLQFKRWEITVKFHRANHSKYLDVKIGFSGPAASRTHANIIQLVEKLHPSRWSPAYNDFPSLVYDWSKNITTENIDAMPTVIAVSQPMYNTDCGSVVLEVEDSRINSALT